MLLRSISLMMTSFVTKRQLVVTGRAAARLMMRNCSYSTTEHPIRGYKPELSSGDLDGRKKVLLYRARQRGYLELDVILGSFADRYLRDMPEGEVDEFEEVLALENPDLYKWLSAQVMKQQKVPDNNSVFRKLLEYTGSKEE